MVQTIRQNYEGYTKKEVEQAKLARKVQGRIGHPTDRNFENMVSHNILKNCPVTKPDVTN